MVIINGKRYNSRDENFQQQIRNGLKSSSFEFYSEDHIKTNRKEVEIIFLVNSYKIKSKGYIMEKDIIYYYGGATAYHYSGFFTDNISTYEDNFIKKLLKYNINKILEYTK